MSKANPAEPTLTDDQRRRISAAMTYHPFRVAWAMIDQDTGTFEVYTSPDDRQARKAARQGHRVFIAHKEPA